MTPRRALTAAVIVIVLAVSLLYDAPTPPPPAESPPMTDINCDYHYERRGLGWEPWVLVEECE